jgi:hypothetical protein
VKLFQSKFRFSEICCSSNGKVFQLARMIRVAGEEKDLVVLGEGSNGLDGGDKVTSAIHLRRPP